MHVNTKKHFTGCMKITYVFTFESILMHNFKTFLMCSFIVFICLFFYIIAKSEVISFDTPLPDFSDMVQQHLLINEIKTIWGTFVDECARYYFNKFPNIQNSAEYQTIGRKMYANYPQIAYAGKEPWV